MNTVRTRSAFLASGLVCALAALGAAAPESAPATGAPATASAAPDTASAAPDTAAPAPPPAPPEEPEKTGLAKTVDDLAAAVKKLKGLKFSGYIQAQFVWVAGSDSGLDAAGAPTEKDLFSIRRGRLKAVYTGVEWAEFVLQIDATTRGLGLRDAEASYVHALGGGKIKLTLGLFKTPIGFELVESSGDRPWPERSRFWGAFVPGERDLGVRVSWAWKWLDVRLALQNGEPIGERTFPGLDTNKGKDVSGRVGLDTKRFDAGLSALYGWGWTPPVAPRPGGVTWDDLDMDGMVDAATGELVGVPAVAAADEFSWPRWTVGADLQAYIPFPKIGDGIVRAEAFLASNLDRTTTYRPSTPDESFLQLGWSVAYLQTLGKFFYVGLRADYYDPDLATAADQVFTLAPLFIVHREAIKFVLTYDLVLDREDDGMGGTVEKKNDVLTARVQVKF